MTHNLEPPDGENDNWDVLYQARDSDEITFYRPIFSGDVFENVEVAVPRAEPKRKTVLVLQHPCAMRPNGSTLAKHILVAEVRKHKLLLPSEWQGYGKLMPIPDLRNDESSPNSQHAAFFDNTYHIHRDDLIIDNRIACLSLRGVNILYQRWIYHSTRVIVPSFDINQVTSHVYEETELIETWCEIALDKGKKISAAIEVANSWLSEITHGSSRRKELENPQLRAQVRRDAIRAAREL